MMFSVYIECYPNRLTNINEHYIKNCVIAIFYFYTYFYWIGFIIWFTFLVYMKFAKRISLKEMIINFMLVAVAVSLFLYCHKKDILGMAGNYID